MPDATYPDAFRPFIGDDGAVQRVRPAAYAWCERSGSLLLCRVSEDEREAGRWTVPGGGLRFGEDPEEALVREVREETGLDVVPGALLGVRSSIIEPGRTASGHRIQSLGLLYRGKLAGGVLRHEADGSTDRAAWIRFADLLTLPLTELASWALAIVDAEPQVGRRGAP